MRREVSVEIGSCALTIISTNFSVTSLLMLLPSRRITARGARDLDLATIILRGGIASGVEENIGFVERISDLISFSALRKTLE
jgi:hypothetical protein